VGHLWRRSGLRYLQTSGCSLLVSLNIECVAFGCSVLQCVAVCCNGLQWVAVGCSGLQCVAVGCSVLQCVVVWILVPLNDEICDWDQNSAAILAVVIL